jgi:hypothetical protein
MKFANVFPNVTLVVSLIVLLSTTAAKGQIVLSNETLATTTFVVNTKTATVKCTQAGCEAEKTILKSILVICPAPNGKTCTFHILFDAKVAVGLPCGGQGCLGTSGATNYFRFLIDGSAPDPGPTTENGLYLFGRNVMSETNYPARQPYAASVLGTVTNGDHLIDISLKCVDTLKFYGCQAEAVISDNVGPCQALFERTTACTQRRAPFRSS